jgi:hypothetical protein
MGEVNLDLEQRQGRWHALGIEALATADLELLPRRELMVLSYKRAVYCRAKAYLLGQFITVVRRDSAENLAKEAPDTASAFLAFSQQAVRLIQDRSRITAELL